MVALDLYDVLAVAARVLGCDSAEVVDRVDADAVASVLAQAQRGPGDLADVAAGLLSGFVRQRTFRGPLRRVSVAVVLQFLALNGHDLEPEPIERLDDLLDGVTDGRLPLSELARALRAGLVPDARPAGDLKAERTTRSQRGEETDVFELFTEPARRVLVLAQEEAGALKHGYVGTEHVLLGLIRERDGVAVKALVGLGIVGPMVRSMVDSLVSPGQYEEGGHIPFTPRAKTAMELAHREALALGHDYLGTEHLLLGLIREGEGIAAQALRRLGADLEKARLQVISELLGGPSRAETVVRDLLTNPGQDFVPHRGGGRSGRRLLAELADLFDENDRLEDEVARLRRKLRDHGIDPDT